MPYHLETPVRSHRVPHFGIEALEYLGEALSGGLSTAVFELEGALQSTVCSASVPTCDWVRLPLMESLPGAEYQPFVGFDRTVVDQCYIWCRLVPVLALRALLRRRM
jgi:hypothetical protein